MNKEIIQGIRKALSDKLEIALITVIHTIGSTPRETGAEMIVFPDGTSVGTIGGGCGEAEARREALNVLSQQKSLKYYLNMNVKTAEDEGMVCGGRMVLFIDYLDFKNNQVQSDLLDRYCEELDNFSNPLLIKTIDAPDTKLIGRIIILSQNSEIQGDLGLPALHEMVLQDPTIRDRKYRPLLLNFDAELSPCNEISKQRAYQLWVEPPVSDVELLVLGGGHIALPLAKMAKILGYKVTVIDDRPSFANNVRFNMADSVICNSFEQALDDFLITPQTYVVIVTRGHRHDKTCLRCVISLPAAYIGMIGSRKRVHALLQDLQEEGFAAEVLQRLYSPIGLKIGAETPEEIALCILGEIVQVSKQTR